MAIKMRVLYNSGKKGMAQFADAVKEKYDLPVNAVSGKFPPENWRTVWASPPPICPS